MLWARASSIESSLPGERFCSRDVKREDSCVLPARNKPVKKKVYLWKRANKQAMEEDLAKLSKKFTKDFFTSTTFE